LGKVLGLALFRLKLYAFKADKLHHATFQRSKNITASGQLDAETAQQLGI